jgi:hypothetical protein
MNYREYADEYACRFGYTLTHYSSDRKQYFRPGKEEIMALTHMNKDKYVTFHLNDESKVLKAGDLLLCVLEGLGVNGEDLEQTIN